MSKPLSQSKFARFIAGLLCAVTLACSAAAPVALPTDVVAPVLADVAATVQTPDVAAPPAEATPAETTEDAAGTEQAEPELELRRLRTGELNAKLIDKSVNVLHATYHEPMGHEVHFEMDEKDYVAKVEWHYREPGSKKLPWGKHRGISLYIYDVASS